MSSRYEEVLANQATWQKVEGVEVLRVKDSPIVAVPTNGRRNSARFQVIDLVSREELCQLLSSEVRGWLFRRNEK